MTRHSSITLTLCVAVLLGGCEDKAEKHRQEQAAAQLRAAETARLQQEKQEQLARQEQVVVEIEAQADAAEQGRKKSIKQHFPERDNAITDCIEKKGGAHVRSDFHFGSETSIAYKIELGEALAQRFIAYVGRASSCTAFGSASMERALIPALPHLQNSKQLVTLIAAVSDLAAREGDNSSRNFSAKVQALVSLF